jgi:hypothetical protein
LTSSNTAGGASNFDAFSNYSFAIATAAGGVSGFDASCFDILTSSFANDMNPAPAATSGSWSITQSGNSINLNYAADTAIPEPATGSMLGWGLAGLLGTRLLRRKSS